MEKIIITGANGFIGSHLTDLCISKGYEVYSLDLPGRSFKNLKQYTDGKLEFSSVDKLKAFGNLIQIPTTNNRLIILECDLKNRILLEEIII